jgi:hypothetical protein
MRDLIGCGACFITAHSTRKTSQWLPVSMYFIKEIENLCAAIKHLGILQNKVFRPTLSLIPGSTPDMSKIISAFSPSPSFLTYCLYA